MRGSIRQRSEGVWEMRATIGRDATGRQVQKSKTVRVATRGAAERALNQWIAEIEATTTFVTGSVTVGDAVMRWYDRQVLSRAWKPVTEENNERIINTWLKPSKLWNRPLGKVRPKDLEDFYLSIVATISSADNSYDGRSTAKHVHKALSAAFNEALRREEIARNPATLAQVPKPAKRRKVPVDIAGIARLIGELERSGNLFAATMVRFAILSGARRGEICALKWSDIDLDEGTIQIRRGITLVRGQLHEDSTKTDDERDLALDAATVELFRRWRDEIASGWAGVGRTFTNEWRVWSPGPDPTSILRPDGVTHRWDTIARRHGVECTFNELRHQNGTWMIALGIDPTIAAPRQGHSVEVHLRTYTHASSAADREVAETLARELDAQAAAPPPADGDLPPNVIPFRRRVS